MKEKDGSQMGDILRDMPVEGVCRLTLNRPDALNSLTYTMYAELIDHLEGVRYDPPFHFIEDGLTVDRLPL